MVGGDSRLDSAQSLDIYIFYHLRPQAYMCPNPLHEIALVVFVIVVIF